MNVVPNYCCPTSTLHGHRLLWQRQRRPRQQNQLRISLPPLSPLASLASHVHWASQRHQLCQAPQSIELYVHCQRSLYKHVARYLECSHAQVDKLKPPTIVRQFPTISRSVNRTKSRRGSINKRTDAITLIPQRKKKDNIELNE